MNDDINLKIRPRRLRANANIRDLIRETKLDVNDLIAAVFVKDGNNIKSPIESMPGFFHYSLDRIEEEINEIVNLGIKAIIIFGIPEHKDHLGSSAYDDNGIVQRAVKKIKEVAPDLLIIADLCFCQYTTLGHCGIAQENKGIITVDNDKSLKILAKQALSLATAGADVLAPSGMLDGMVKAIRKILDQNNFSSLPILSYAVKYRSAMYGPFGAAAGGAAKQGDRQTYQMDPANSNEALREAMLDIEEGADILMVKPAHTYLDIIFRLKQNFPFMPIAAYHPSGEYMMLKSAIDNGCLEEKRSIMEVITSIKRAGASMIITYFAKDLAKWLHH